MSSTTEATSQASGAAERQRKEPGRREGGFRPDIQGLRAIAVPLVVIYHLYPSVLPGGFAGVDVFSSSRLPDHRPPVADLPEDRAAEPSDFWGRRSRRLIRRPPSCWR